MKILEIVIVAALFVSVFIAISASASEERNYNRVSELLSDEAHSSETNKNSLLGEGRPFVLERISELLSDGSALVNTPTRRSLSADARAQLNPDRIERVTSITEKVNRISNILSDEAF